MAKKLLITLFIVALFASCGGRKNTPTTDRGVVIDGIRWATRNVETPGTFAENPANAGGFFTFDEAQNACPQGWRVPTLDELRSLYNAGSEWTTKNGVNGRLFGSGRNQLFLPAAGFRNASGGGVNDAGAIGYFWGRALSGGTHAWVLWVVSGNVGVTTDTRDLYSTIRCVSIN